MEAKKKDGFPLPLMNYCVVCVGSLCMRLTLNAKDVLKLLKMLHFKLQNKITHYFSGTEKMRARQRETKMRIK